MCLGHDRTEVGLDHHVDLARFGPLTLRAAIGADDLGHRHGLRISDFFLLRMRLLHVVLPVPLVALQTLNEGVVEYLDMAGGHPYLPRQDDRRIQADDVVAAGDHGAPPLSLDVLLEFHTQRSVVPRRAGTPVDLACGIDQTAALGQVDDGLDDRRHVGVALLSAECLCSKRTALA